MSTVEEILKSGSKPKEKVNLLAKEVKENRISVRELIEYFGLCSISEKGSCMEAMEVVSRENPEILLPHIDFIIEQISSKAPRVKWETARVVANISQKYPKEAAKAVPKLLVNTNDKGTVVRWSAAFALTQIAKSNPELRKELLPKFKEIAEKEENNGVKNIYSKAIKKFEK